MFDGTRGNLLIDAPAFSERALRLIRGAGPASVLLITNRARGVAGLRFSAVLSARRPPMWNAGRDTLLQLQRALPQPNRRFGILLQAPWDRAYKGRLEDQMKPNPLIVPADRTAAREAAMGPGTLVVSQQVRARTEAAPRPLRTAPPPGAPSAAGAAGPRERGRGAPPPRL